MEPRLKPTTRIAACCALAGLCLFGPTAVRVLSGQAAPRVSGEFKVENGGFRQFTYESFGGTMNYETRGITIDARLQQTADQWITAKGYAPTALFTSPGKTEEQRALTGHVEPTEAEPQTSRLPSDPLATP